MGEVTRLVKAVRDVVSGAPAPDQETLLKGSFPPPWEGELLLCLLRHIDRQRWLVRTVERIQRPVRGLPRPGDVPGHPDWRYRFHGTGCCFTGPGETIDMDFGEDAERTVDGHFFARRILSLGAPALPEARLAALLPGSGLITIALSRLSDRGLLLSSPRNQPLPELLALETAAVNLKLADEEERRRCLAHFGDFEALETLPGGDVFRARAEEARHVRRSWLLEAAREPSARTDAEKALASLPATDAPRRP